MTLLRIFLMAMVQFVVAAQPNPGDVATLRNQAIAERSVEVRVTTRAVADAASIGAVRTEAQYVAIQRAQHKVLIQLISRGLVVGNEINLQPDGSFTLRVLPAGLAYLAASGDIATLDTVATRREAGR